MVAAQVRPCSTSASGVNGTRPFRVTLYAGLVMEQNGLERRYGSSNASLFHRVTFLSFNVLLSTECSQYFLLALCLWKFSILSTAYMYNSSLCLHPSEALVYFNENPENTSSVEFWFPALSCVHTRRSSSSKNKALDTCSTVSYN